MDLLTALYISLGINILMFIPAFIWKTDKLTDISYAVTFAVVALGVLVQSTITIPSLILLVMVLLWALRLGTYLFIRINKIGKDKRFDGMREYFWKFARFWLLQGITVWVVMLPSIYFLSDASENITPIMYVGFFVWLVGLLVESFADYQKYTFINNPENKGKWIETGVWRYSRHPNYFGEISVWAGVYIFALSALVGLEIWVGLLSPLYIAGLILFVSGVPMLERAADERWGQNSQYRAYKKRTSVLIPWFVKHDA